MADQMSSEDALKFERAGKILLADTLQMAGRHAIAWLSLNEELGIYFIGLRSGELRWLPRDSIDTSDVAGV